MYLRKVLGRHLGEDSVEVALVLLVDEPIVKHPLGLVAVESEDVVVLTNHSRVCLEHT